MSSTARRTRIGSLLAALYPHGNARALSRRLVEVAGLAGLVASGAAYAQHALPPGTIPVVRGVVSGAVVGTPVATPSGESLTITQSAQGAIIDWLSFNIANGSRVQFLQPNSTAVALNRIFDLNPSLIQGQLLANGQVWLVNQNGIVFDRGAQINVHNLVASTLNIDNSLVATGIASGQVVAPAMIGGYDSSGATTATTPTGTIQIGRAGDGAQAPQITTAAGGSIILVAPSINNTSGLISAPDGQVILAAGSSVYLMQSQSTTGPAVRGLAVQITAPAGAPVNLTSLIRNSGQIMADRGNVTLAAMAVNQDGRVSASSSALYNGTVILQAQDRTLDGGTVTLGQGSVTAAPIDTSDTTQIAAAQSFTAGSVSIIGKTIVNQGDVLATGGTISLNATDQTDPTAARIYLASGSVLDASGAWSNVPYASTLQTLRVTSNELANSPDQKGGILEGATVTVDLNEPSTILDISGFQSTQLITAPQKAAAGGSVSLVSTGDVIDRLGSTISVAGGGVHVAGGLDTSSMLLGANGQLYNINSAPEAQEYLAVFGQFTVAHPHWGQTDTYNTAIGLGTTAAGYTQGAAGGSVSISTSVSSGLVLDGSIVAGATIGPRQLTDAPRGGSLVVGASSDPQAAAGINNVSFTSIAGNTLGAGFGVDSSLSSAQINHVVLSNQLMSAGAGFDSVEIEANDTVTLPAGVTLSAPTGGTIALVGNQINIGGTIKAPAGTIDLTTQVQGGAQTPSITLASGAQLSTAGLWLNNDSTDGGPVGPVLPSAIAAPAGAASSAAISTLAGGQVTLSAPVVTLASGSSINANGGGSISAAAGITGGQGGTITITAPSSTYNDPLHGTPLQDTLDGTLSAYSLTQGGSLQIVTGLVSIGNTQAAGSANQLDLTPKFFQSGGFASYSVDGAFGLNVAPGTALHPLAQSEVVSAAAAAGLASGGNLAGIADIMLLPVSERAPTSITLSASNPSANPLVIGAGASIVTDPRGSVTLSAVTGLTVDGSITAPGGAINLALSGPTIGGADSSAVTLMLGSQAQLSTAGIFAASPNSTGLATGTVYGGGDISLSATNGIIATAAGSSIDVSGTSHTLDEFSNSSTAPLGAVAVASNAGSVTLTATDGLILGGQFAGRAGGTGAAGGSFVLQLRDRNDSVQASSALARDVVLSNAPAAFNPGGEVTVDLALQPLLGAGFDKLRVQSENVISFNGNVGASFARGITLDAPQYLLRNGAQVTLGGTEVALINSWGSRTLDPNDNGSNAPFNGSAAPVLATTPGSGRLTVHANNIDLYGSLTVNGAQAVNLDSTGDIRLSGRPVLAADVDSATLVGGLATEGNVNLSAAQVYPTTLSQFTIAVVNQPPGDPGASSVVPGGHINIASHGAPQDLVLSAGGELTLSADTIVQAGTLRAPLGQINLDATTNIVLTAGSLTSVSAAGLVIPFGETEAGVQWLYGPTNFTPGVSNLTAPPAKSISLSAPQVTQNKGATIDLSGGGDILASEFVPGSGGSTDFTTQANTYAIMPAAGFGVAPYDPDIAGRNNTGMGFSPTQSRDNAVYDSIQIGPGGIVAAGTYVLLPALYANLPGAYLVTLQTGSTYSNLSASGGGALTNGMAVLSGRLVTAGTDIAQSTTVGVVVQPGSALSKYSDFTLTGSSFFAKQAQEQSVAIPELPQDAGTLEIAAVNSLTLDGSFMTRPAGSGAAARVDITGDNIALVNQVGQSGIDPGYLQIATPGLSDIDANLLIGGTRVDQGNGVLIHATAQNIIVANTAADPLAAPELILVASDSITLDSGSVISGSGKTLGQARAITTDASGALVRVANSQAVTVDRGAQANASSGTITIDAGATLRADQSMLVDATQSTTSRGTLAVKAGGALSLGAPTIALGDFGSTPPANAGLALNSATLASFDDLGQLILKGADSITLYGTTTLGSTGLGSLTLDSPVIAGATSGSSGTAAQTTLMAANSVTLLNSGQQAPATLGSGPGSLVVDSTQINLGAGMKSIQQYGTVTLDATHEVMLEGSGSLAVAAPLTIATAAVVATAGANQSVTTIVPGSLTAQYPINVTSNGNAAPALGGSAIGAQVQFTGSGISDSTAIVAHSGAISLTANGAGGITLGSGALLDASGASQGFNGDIQVSDAGSVTLNAKGAPIQLAAGSAIDVSAAAAGGNAGTISLTSQSLALAGNLEGSSSAAGGTFNLNVGQLSDFSGLNTALNTGGFSAARTIRVNTGDLTVGASDDVVASQVTLVADAGVIDVNGRIDASGSTGGGSVTLYAQNGIALAAGSTIDARGTSSDASATGGYANGGTVDLETRSGTLSFAAGAVIDVSPGAKGHAGSVTFVAPQVQDGGVYDGVQVALAGTIDSQSMGGAGQASVTVLGQRVYQNAAPSSADITGYGTDYAAFVQDVNSAQILAQLQADHGALQGATVSGAIEIDSAASMVLNNPWTLTTGAYAAGAAPGLLTLRSAGDVTINSTIGLPDDTVLSGASWSVRVAAGADLASASPMAVQSLAQLGGVGSVMLPTATSKIRTGSGNIQIAAGQDFDIGNAAAVVYSSGMVAAPDGTLGRWDSGGGNISIYAQGNINGTASDEFVTDWLRRPVGGRAVGGGLNVINGSWWSYLPDFQQNIGSFGGGAIDIRADGNIAQLSAAVPTAGLVNGTGATQQLTVYGGGNLTVSAGGSLDGGSFLLGLGSGRISANGSIGATTPIALYMMGASSDAARATENLSVIAGDSLTVQSVINPTAEPLTGSIGTGPSFNASNQTRMTFFTYSDSATLNLAAKTGDITLGLTSPDVSGLSQSASDQTLIANAVQLGTVLPPTVNAVAFNGNLQTVAPGGPSEMVLYPSASGSARILAAGSISNLDLTGSDLIEASLPTWSNAASFALPLGIPSDDLDSSPTTTTARIVTRTTSSPFVFDVQALAGDITGSEFTLPGNSRIYAGGNIIGPVASGNEIYIENLAPNDVSVIQADHGNVLLNGERIDVAGAGQLLLQAGGTIDLGATSVVPQLVADGSQENQSLTGAGSARLTLVAGVSGSVDLANLQSALNGVQAAGELTSGTPQQHTQAAEQAMDGFLGTSTAGSGSINSYLTSIQTTGGSAIDLIAPHGDITVGLTSPAQGIQIGVVTNAGGAINSFLSGNFLINSGKVVTALGGDIMIFTTDGNIDAGRGAKTSITAPAPVRTCDASGNCVYTLSAGVTGSGIETVTAPAEPGEPAPPPAGNIFLFAPAGYVNAGEAGISSGGNIFIAAQQVLNASNISSAGSSVGVPVVQSGSVAASLTSSGAVGGAGVDKAAQDAAQAAANAVSGLGDLLKPGLLTVEVLGFGAANCPETKPDCKP